MNNRAMLTLCAGIAAAATTAHAQVEYLMVLNSSSIGTGRRVMLFSHVDGTLLNDNFIHESTVPDGWRTVKGIQQIGEEIWISDQTRARLYRYDASGNLLAVVGEGLLSNIRGFAHHDGTLYISNARAVGSVLADSIVRLDLNGNLLGSFVVGNSPFDVFIVDSNEMLVSHSSNGDVTRWDLSGNSLGNFYTGPMHFAQQITRRANDNFLVAGWSGAAASGTYELDPQGNAVEVYPTGSVRAAYELANGNIFWSGPGFNIYDTAGNFNTQIADGTGQYILAWQSLDPPCYADCNADGTLNINDFLCFIDEFALAQSLPPAQQQTHYANCTGATSEPILNINDFLCFIDEFAQGCP